LNFTFERDFRRQRACRQTGCYLSLIGAALVIVFSAALMADSGKNVLPSGFSGQILVEGRRPLWSPDGTCFSYLADSCLMLYEMTTGQKRKLAELNAAECIWLNADSILAVEWPPDVGEKQRKTKIINYRIITRSGQNTLLAADTSHTDQIPQYSHPFRLPDGQVCLTKNKGWKTDNLPQTEKCLCFAEHKYDLAQALKRHTILSFSSQEGGSIHFKTIEKETVKTIAPGRYLNAPRLSPNHALLLAYQGSSLVVLDSSGKIMQELEQLLTPAERPGFEKHFGAEWNHGSNGLIFFEVFNQPEKRITISYFDLAAGSKTAISETVFFGRDRFEFSPDDRQVLTWLPLADRDIIVLLQVPTGRPKP